MPNAPGMGNPPDTPTQLGVLVGKALNYAVRAVDGLTVEQLCDTHGGITNSVGWDVWHVVRTIDNMVHFVFEREQPVWLQHSFHERWNLPRVDQGTGQDPNDAYSMRFPDANEFTNYIVAVADAVVPRIKAMDEAYLSTVLAIRPWGDIPRIEAIAYGLIMHSNGHLGRASLARALWGLRGLGY